MNKSPQYNQQTEPKQCKSEVEEICIHQNLETCPIAELYLKINGRFRARENPSEATISESSQIRELHETFRDSSFSKSAFMFTTIQPL